MSLYSRPFELKSALPPEQVAARIRFDGRAPAVSALALVQVPATPRMARSR